jgi:DNA-binding response OmpR family regulator
MLAIVEGDPSLLERVSEFSVRRGLALTQLKSAAHAQHWLQRHRADLLLLDVTPRQLVEIAGDQLPPAYRQKLEQYRYGPGVFKMDWALSGPIP